MTARLWFGSPVLHIKLPFFAKLVLDRGSYKLATTSSHKTVILGGFKQSQQAGTSS